MGGNIFILILNLLTVSRMKVLNESANQEINVLALQTISHLVKIFCIHKEGAPPPQTLTQLMQWI